MTHASFDAPKVLQELKRYLPAQAPLKDFIFQNTLASFQDKEFLKALSTASQIFGYKVFLSMQEFRNLYAKGSIREDILDRTISQRKGAANLNEWKDKLLSKQYDNAPLARVGQLRPRWKRKYKIDLDSRVHPALFRIICSFLDQGISIWNFPVWKYGLLHSVKEIEKNSFTSFFRTERARKLLIDGDHNIEHLLKIVVGNPAYYEQYLFDQQFAHQGWSGMVSVIEDKPETLIDSKKVSLREFIILELILEIDALEYKLGKGWQPLCGKLAEGAPVNLFEPVTDTALHEAQSLWQEAYEWSYYDNVLAGISFKKPVKETKGQQAFQALFCIDDREISLRDYIEKCEPNCVTYGTPGFFNVEFYFQPELGKSYTKLCPAPVTPKFLIKEIGTRKRRNSQDAHFNKQSHSLFAGMVVSPALGIWSAFKLAYNIFKPSMTPATASSFKHMDRVSKLTIEHDGQHENNLQIGYTIEEMATRVEGLLRSIDLIKDFAPVVYVIGHGASSVNNPFYATMDCGACSCRPGSVNSRVFCHMANHPEVRVLLAKNGLVIPEETQFLGGLHDTTRDEIVYYDEHLLTYENIKNHYINEDAINKALDLNAKERARRFELIDSSQSVEDIHKDILRRSMSLFEPRPELDHANNAVTIIGSRGISKGLFLDRRSFLNSYDHKNDPEGKLLFNILKPIAPVCGGINLNYYFSRVDNHKLGAGSKLPHNVMGLFGVANGADGDLRPGLPLQMVEAHDPIRQIVIVEHYPDVLLGLLKALPTYQWFSNNWMHVAVIHPDTRAISIFRDGEFHAYKTLQQKVEIITDVTPYLEITHSLDNIPVYIIS